MIFRAGPIDMLEINAHAKSIVLLGDHDDIGKPLGVVDFTDELCCQQSSHFFADCFSLLHGGPPKVLFDGFYLGVDTQTVLS